MNPSLPSTTEQLPSEHQTPGNIEIQSIKTEKRSSLKVKGVTEEMKALCLVPLQDGWTREIRVRHTQDLRAADIYYFAPDGTRFRSRPEVVKYLEKNCITKYNMNNFSFYYEPLGGECAHYEVVRMCGIGFRPKTANGQNDRTVFMTIPPTEEYEEETKPVVANPSKKWEPRDLLQLTQHQYEEEMNPVANPSKKWEPRDLLQLTQHQYEEEMNPVANPSKKWEPRDLLQLTQHQYVEEMNPVANPSKKWEPRDLLQFTQHQYVEEMNPVANPSKKWEPRDLLQLTQHQYVEEMNPVANPSKKWEPRDLLQLTQHQYVEEMNPVANPSKKWEPRDLLQLTQHQYVEEMNPVANLMKKWEPRDPLQLTHLQYEEEMNPVTNPSKKWEPRDPLRPTQPRNRNDKRCCICTGFEWGQMVKCSNEGCVIKLYHLGCVVLSEVPKHSQSWYCPICRDSDPGTLNPAYAAQNGSS